MAYKTATTGDAFFNPSAIIYRATIANLAISALGVAAFGIFKAGLTLSFVSGYALGVVNIYMLLRLSRRLSQMPPEKAGGFMLRNYYIRFFSTAAILAFLIYMGLSPWALVVGVGGSIFTTIAVIISKTREEALQ